MTWFDLLGWAGSLLVILSLTQARVLRFRWLNLVGAALATVYNAVIGVWPFAVMNGVITIIDVYWVLRLHRERHDDVTYEVIEVGIDDALWRHILAVHRDDLATFHPDTLDPTGDDRSVWVVARRDETVGIVVVRDAGDGVGRVEIDYVTPRFRDFTPGEFVYRTSGIFAAKGFRTLEHGDDASSRSYLERVGFERAGDVWRRPVAA
ncbi:hypothetical protein [Cellulomonas edaphi]|uniref:YgjV family protein n=1 Tax=Cellulomonas edaphi TaxID=3053468 RepID=A0ABT7S3R8_9CELL|nr:hypothetical protein [Cellulomons edaphi]MDM7830258.1 hypothetical protein [Cellulomons edaphi]